MKTAHKTLRRLAAGLTLAVTAAVVGASAASAAAPAPVSIPQIEGNTDTPFVGDTLTATTGSWSGSPTSYAYQWRRCDALGDRRNCLPIAGASAAKYTVAKADVGHTLSVVVTAKNADGSTAKDSKGTGIVSDTVAPKLYVRPTISGTATVGDTLTGTTGTWAGATSFSFQWQQCDLGGNNCVAIAGANGRSFGVRTADVGKELRLEVTATNKYGSTKAYTTFTDAVTAGTPSTTTTVVTTTVAGDRAPSLRFLSLKRAGERIYARFRVCDDRPGTIRVVERDNKSRQLAYTRRLTVHVGYSCASYARHWTLLKRYRSHGRFVVTLRARDAQGRFSRLVSRGLTIR